MRSLFLTIMIVSVFAVASPAFADVNANIVSAYAAYLESARTGDLEKALPHFSKGAQDFYKTVTKTPEGRELLAGIIKDNAAQTYEVKRVVVGKDGASARIEAEIKIAAISRPELKLPAGYFETRLFFVNEGGKWKLDGMLDTADLGNMKRPADYIYNPADINEGSSGSIGGLIVKLVFEKDHTLVVVRVMDSENAVFLPAKEELIRDGANLAMFEPGKIVEFEGNPHKTDKLKFFATGAREIEVPPNE